MVSESRILLVDDEESIRNVLKSVLTKEGYEVHTADSGAGAQAVLGLEDFHAIISDINMPGEVSGIDLLKYTSEHHGDISFIIMTGFLKAFKTQDAFNMGAKAFLAKPFKREELLSVLRKECGLPAKKEMVPEIAPDTNTYCRVSIDQFISGRTLKFEIFIRLGAERFAKIAHEGEDLDFDRIQVFKSKGVEYLYIKTTDFAKYVGFNLDLSKAAKGSTTISREKKTQIAKGASAVIMENLFVNGVSPEKFDQARQITETTLNILAESKESFDLLESLSATGDSLYTHSLGVSLFGAMIARQLGWDAPSTLFRISTAGLFHDIGLKEIDRRIVEKPRHTLTVEEVKLLESHCERGVVILGSMPGITPDILQIVLQHHESADGRGYPSHLQRSEINPIARLISLADEFCELALHAPGSAGMSARAALERIELIRSDGFDAVDLQYLNALKAVCGIETDECLAKKVS